MDYGATADIPQAAVKLEGRFDSIEVGETNYYLFLCKSAA